MVREIIKHQNQVLRRKSEEIKEVTEDIKSLAQEMLECLKENKGIGLAAPQIGELKRIIIVQAGKGIETFINPRILGKSKESSEMEEGCLSFPGIFLKIKRAKEVEVEALNLKREKINVKAEGLSARIFQHEIDHLDGILFADRLGFWQKLKIRKKLKCLEPGSKH